MSESELDQVFRMLEAAKIFERKGSRNVEAATKYYEAVYSMRRIVDGMTGSSTSAKRQLLQGQIRQYEQKARQLVMAANDDYDEAAVNEIPVAIATAVDQNLDESSSWSFVHTTASSSPLSVASAATDSTSSATSKEVHPVPLSHSSLWSFRNTIQKRSANKLEEQADQANTVLAKALDLDEAGLLNQAAAAYAEAAELYLRALKLAHEKQEKISGGGKYGAKYWSQVMDLIQRRLECTLERAEQIKKKEVSAA